MSRIKTLMFLLAMAAQVSLASATVTRAVGACQPKLISFTTITLALAATPSPNVVKVCPGTYNEQVVITKPVILEGISDGISSGATIAVPPGGLVANATDSFGGSIAAQVLVENVSGEVNLSGLTVDGTGNNVTSATFVVGVFYKNSPGTVNHVTAQNQNGNNGYLAGVGIWLDGGSANPSVTVENSNVQGFDNTGIIAQTNSTVSELTAAIDGNDIGTSSTSFGTGISIGMGGTISASGNLIVGPVNGIVSIEGSVSKNTVVGAVFHGIFTEFASVTSNTIFSPNADGLTADGIFVDSSTAAVTGNTITESSAFNGVDFNCIAGNNVHSNTIMGAGGGLINVPTSAVTANTYYSVGTISSGGCP